MEISVIGMTTLVISAGGCVAGRCFGRFLKPAYCLAGGGLVLIDYKNSWAGEGEEEAAVTQRYAGQIRLYREAKEKKTVVSSFVLGFAPTGSDGRENENAPKQDVLFP